MTPILSPLPTASLLAFDSDAELNQWLTAHPRALLVARCLGQRARTGQVRAVVAEYPSLATRDAAAAALSIHDRDARSEYFRHAQSVSRARARGI